MHQFRLDKRTIVGPRRPQIKTAAAFIQWPALLVAAIVMATLLAGCAAMPVEDNGETAADPAVQEVPDGLPEEIASDPDVMFHILAAERLGAVGEYGDALDHYLDAAMLSDDPRVAEQVTRLGATLGEWEVVTAGARRWLELEPDSQAARQVAVVGLLRQGDAAGASDLLAETLVDSDDPDRAWRAAINLLAAADAELAEAALLDLLERTGDDQRPGSAALQRSRLDWQLGDEASALEHAATAAGLDPRRETRVWAAQLSVANDDFERALVFYRAAREDEPDDLELGLAEAEVLRQMEQLDAALEVLEAFPDDLEVLYTRGSYLHAAERHEEALKVWQVLAATAPEDQETHAYYTGVLADLLELEAEAAEWYGRVDSGGFRQRAQLRSAVLLGRQGDQLRARNVLRSLRLEGSERLSEQAWMTEAQILSEAGRDEEALQVLSTALTELPNSIPLLYSRALTAVGLDNIELAEQDLRAILFMDPENAVALNALGYTLTDRTSRHREALRLIERAYILEPDNPAIQDSMGWVYFNLGQPERALPYLREALEGDYHPEIAAHLGEVLMALGEEEEAREVLRKAREEFPDDDYLAESLQRLGVEP